MSKQKIATPLVTKYPDSSLHPALRRASASQKTVLGQTLSRAAPSPAIALPGVVQNSTSAMCATRVRASPAHASSKRINSKLARRSSNRDNGWYQLFGIFYSQARGHHTSLHTPESGKNQERAFLSLRNSTFWHHSIHSIPTQYSPR